MKYILSNTAAIAVFARLYEIHQNIFAALICGVLFGILTGIAVETMKGGSKHDSRTIKKAIRIVSGSKADYMG